MSATSSSLTAAMSPISAATSSARRSRSCEWLTWPRPTARPSSSSSSWTRSTSGRRTTFDYCRGGAFHFPWVDPDVEGLVERIVATGGRQRSKVWTVLPGQPYKAVYCEDPFGNIIEVFSHSHESTFANQ
jgi:hypothetical protein